MHKSSWARRGQLAAGALGVALGSWVGSAQAAVFVANWDPFFSNAFQAATGVDLNWEGTNRVTLDDSCLVPSTVQTVGSLQCPNAIVDAYSYLLTWTLPAPNSAGGFGSSIGGFNNLLQVSIGAGGEVDGVQMDVPLQVNIAPVSIGSSDWNVFLDLTTLGEVRLRLDGVAGPQAGNTFFNDNINFPPTVVWTRVPEPGTLLLAGLALGAVGWVRRRR
jgi:hypothetical protein